MPGRGGGLSLVECKAGRTVAPPMARPMLRLAEALRRARPAGPPPRLLLVHEPLAGGIRTPAVAPGVRALPWTELTGAL